MQHLIVLDHRLGIDVLELGLERRVRGAGGGAGQSGSDADGRATPGLRQDGEVVAVGATLGLEGVDGEVFEFGDDGLAPRTFSVSREKEG